MPYTELSPCAELQKYIDAYWIETGLEQQDPANNRILPDGCVDIIYNAGAVVHTINEKSATCLENEKFYMVGTMTRFCDTLVQPESKLVGVRFKPAAFSLFCEIPLVDFVDNCYEITNLVPQDIYYSNNIKAGFDKYFLTRKKENKHALFPVIDSIINTRGNIKIDALAARHYTTKRQLERHFKQQLGIGPKQFSNIVRFRFAINQIKQYRETMGIENIAFETGYYDYAHLLNELKRYTGLSPAAF
ncbi:MAG: DUF6597 domain-containing transcriptional factor [Mucilaginibacter sp.]